MNYIILNGIHSDYVPGLLIQTLPPISKPMVRTTVEEIDGRDGDIVTKLGYSAYDKSFEIGLYGNYDINEIIAYFNTEGTVVFSNEPDKYYKYQILDQIDFEKLIRFRTATVTMHVQPFKYSTTEGTIVKEAEIITAEGTDLTLIDTALEQFNEVQLKGNTQQQTYEGRNKFPLINSETKNGITATLNGDGSVTFNGTSTSNNVDFYAAGSASNYVDLKIPAGTYYLSRGTAETGITLWVVIKHSDNTTTSNSISNNTKKEITIIEGDTFRMFARVPTNGTVLNNIIIYPLLTANQNDEFEKYVGGIESPNTDFPQTIKTVVENQQIKIRTKNFFPLINSQTLNGITATLNENGSVNFNGTHTASQTDFYAAGSSNNYVDLKIPVGTYYLSRGTAETGVTLFVVIKHSDNTTTTRSASSNVKVSVTIAEGDTFRMFARVSTNGTVLNNITIYPLLTANQNDEFEKYQEQSITLSLPTGMELCKIGNYQDYIYKNENKWYKHKTIGKIVFDGTENFSIYTTTSGDYVYAYGVTNYNRVDQIICKCTHFTADKNSGYSILTNGKCHFRYNANDEITWFYMCTNQQTTTTDFKSWLTGQYANGTPVTVYYQLAEAVEEEITDTTLLTQLETLLNANSYEGTTYITSIGNLPAIIYVKVYASENLTVQNNGNIISKPIITIYGTGDIGVYLNSLQIFQIALGNEGQITLDTTNMEAYNKDTLEYKNRLVTGNYNNFVLNIGSNTINFSGIVTRFDLLNYSRWI